MNTPITADTLTAAPSLIAGAARPVVGALADPADRVFSVIDGLDTDGLGEAVSTVADATVDGAKAAAEPIRRNPWRVTALLVAGLLGAALYWKLTRRRADEPEQLRFSDAA